jgi:hypothetical protein
MRHVGYLFFSIHAQPLAQHFIRRFGFALKLISLSDKTIILTRKPLDQCNLAVPPAQNRTGPLRR